MSEPTRFVIFGDGWRSRFFCRVAAALPDKLQVLAVIGKHEGNLERISREYGVPTTTESSDLAKYSPDYVAAVVSWPQTPVLTTQLVHEGYKVLCETPPAPDLEGLRTLWENIGAFEAQVQVGEQYYRMPGHASRLHIVRDKVIGTPNSVEIASTHLYHAVALIRDYLGKGLASVEVNARQFTAPMLNPLQFDGWVENPAPEQLHTHIATLDFLDGSYGLYNFVDNQWWNPLLSRRIVVRGSLGELVDDTVLRWSHGAPVTSHLEYRRVGVDMNLEGNEVATVSFDGVPIYSNPCFGSKLSEDDIAVADHLIAMGKYAREEGPAIYSLADGIHDHAIGLAIEESARTGTQVSVRNEAWMR